MPRVASEVDATGMPWRSAVTTLVATPVHEVHGATKRRRDEKSWKSTSSSTACISVTSGATPAGSPAAAAAAAPSLSHVPSPATAAAAATSAAVAAVAAAPPLPPSPLPPPVAKSAAASCIEAASRCIGTAPPPPPPPPPPSPPPTTTAALTEPPPPGGTRAVLAAGSRSRAVGMSRCAPAQRDPRPRTLESVVQCAPRRACSFQPQPTMVRCERARAAVMLPSRACSLASSSGCTRCRNQRIESAAAVCATPAYSRPVRALHGATRAGGGGCATKGRSATTSCRSRSPCRSPWPSWPSASAASPSSADARRSTHAASCCETVATASALRYIWSSCPRIQRTTRAMRAASPCARCVAGSTRASFSDCMSSVKTTTLSDGWSARSRCSSLPALRPVPESYASSSRYDSGRCQPVTLRMARCSTGNHAPV
eukprot:scaffold12381_cov63-Phaeocystis_antarctica.AAC.5